MVTVTSAQQGMSQLSFAKVFVHEVEGVVKDGASVIVEAALCSSDRF